MKFYRDVKTQEVFAYEKDGSQDHLIAEHLARMAPDEIEALQVVVKTASSVEMERLAAYADPLTGSDRLFSESMRMQIMSEEGHEDVRVRAIARFEEIQAAHPWPAD